MGNIDVTFINELDFQILDSAEHVFCSSSNAVEIKSSVSGMCDPRIEGDMCIIVDGTLAVIGTDDQSEQYVIEMGANIVRSAINEVVYGGIQLLYKDLTTMEGTEIVTLQNKETTNTPDSVKVVTIQVPTKKSVLIALGSVIFVATAAFITRKGILIHRLSKRRSASPTELTRRKNSIDSGNTDSEGDSNSIVSDSEITVQISNRKLFTDSSVATVRISNCKLVQSTAIEI